MPDLHHQTPAKFAGIGPALNQYRTQTMIEDTELESRRHAADLMTFEEAYTHLYTVYPELDHLYLDELHNAIAPEMERLFAQGHEQLSPEQLKRLRAWIRTS